MLEADSELLELLIGELEGWQALNKKLACCDPQEGGGDWCETLASPTTTSTSPPNSSISVGLKWCMSWELFAGSS